MRSVNFGWAHTADVLKVAIDLKIGLREFQVVAIISELGKASSGEIKKRLEREPTCRIIEQRITVLIRKGILKRAVVEKGEWKWPEYTVTPRVKEKFASCLLHGEAGSKHADKT